MAEWETGTRGGWESAPLRLNPNLAAQGATYEGARESLRLGAEFMSQRDPGIDYSTGVKNAAFRAGFSRMDNDAEKEQFLNNSIGKGAWSKDSFGAYFIKPEGLRKLGIKSETPMAMDEQRTTLYDVADIAGDIPPIAGAVAGGMAASGAGLLPAAGLAALTAAGAKGIDEVVKNLQGQQVKSAVEVAGTLAQEGGMAALGEGVARGVGAIGRYALGPGAARMTPEKKALADSAIEQGFKIRAGSVTDAPILARWEGMVRQIFGDKYAERNARAAAQGLTRLSEAAGPKVSVETAGEAVVKSIQKQRVAFSERMSERYAEVDRLVGDAPIVPTAAVKQRAQDLLATMPQTSGGGVVGGKDKVLQEVMQMGDNMTVRQAQRLRTMFREASESPDLLPDMSRHDARELHKAVNEAFDNAKARGDVPSEAVAKLRATDQVYAQGIRQFDLPIIRAIAKDASRRTVDEDMVVDYIVRPDRVVRLRQIKALVPDKEWAKVKSAHAQKLLGDVVQGTDDPLVNVFNGKAFRDSLDKYGRDALEQVHGKEWVDSAYKYANALMLSEKRQALSGGIVAANIALHPVKNLPQLLWIGSLARIMEQPGTFKYLTEGFKFGPQSKQAGAAVNRLLSQTMALARDETGSARFTLTEPTPQ